jgi:anti-anti-sigma factor
MEAGSDCAGTRRRAGDAVVVVPVGEIDLATDALVEDEITAARAESSFVVLDLRAVTFMDSAGIRLVVEGVRRLAEDGGEFAVVRGPAEVQRVFDLVGLEGRVRLLDAPPGE